jgi:hypothetical protein
MIKFNKPQNLNGLELINELKAAGVSIEKPPLIDGNDDFWLEVDPADEAKAAAVVAAHNGTTIASEPTPADKLTAAGLTVDELKAVLGLN